MAELSIKEGMKAYVEDMKRELKEGWGKWLSEDEREGVMEALAAFAEEEWAFMETAWSPENQDRLENQMKQLVDNLIQDAKAQANDSGNAADFDEDDFFSRIKITVGDGPDETPGSYTLTAEVEENSPPDNEDPSVEFTVATADMDYRVVYPRQELDVAEFDFEDIWREKEMGSHAYDDLIENGPQFEDQSGGSTMQEEEMSDNIVAHSQSASQHGDDSGVADHSLVDADSDDRSPLPGQEGWEHGLGENVMESIEKDDLSVVDYDVFTEDILSEGPDGASVAGPSNYQEMGEVHNDYSPNDFFSDDAHSDAPLPPRDLEDEEDTEYDPKGKQPQQGKAKVPAEHHRHKSNHLWDVVVNADKPDGLPAGYICKLAGCNGWQGKWKGRQAHFEIKHPEEWFALTGRRAKVFTCDVDGCGWSTHGASYLRIHRKGKHGLGEE